MNFLANPILAFSLNLSVLVPLSVQYKCLLSESQVYFIYFILYTHVYRWKHFIDSSDRKILTTLFPVQFMELNIFS